MLEIGVNTDGYRKVLGLILGDTESEESWKAFFSWLKQRDLRSVELVVSNDYDDLIRQQLQGVVWQRCQTHFMRNMMNAETRELKSKIYTHIRVYARFWSSTMK